MVNSRSTLSSAPMATLLSIGEALKAIAARMDRDEDILFLFLTSHGSREHELSLRQSHMTLRDLPARELGHLLKESGIRWKVIVVSACYSGGFIDPLKDDRTLIMTASAANRTSFGCGAESDATYFGDALFQHALRFEDSFVKAFEQAKKQITERERSERREASNPQIFVGEQMGKKLPKLEAELRKRRSGGSI